MNDVATNGGSGGGAVFASGAFFSASSDTFVNDTALNGRGGGIEAVFEAVNVTNSKFTGDTGGVRSRHPPEVMCSMITALTRHVQSGGAINILANVYVDVATSFLTNDSFTGNSAEFGGALELFQDGNVSVVNSTFTANVASTGGGAAQVFGSTVLNAQGNKFIKNTAAVRAITAIDMRIAHAHCRDREALSLCLAQ